MFFKHFASKKQLPGFYIRGTLVENELIKVNFELRISKINLKLKINKKIRSKLQVIDLPISFFAELAWCFFRSAMSYFSLLLKGVLQKDVPKNTLNSQQNNCDRVDVVW